MSMSINDVLRQSLSSLKIASQSLGKVDWLRALRREPKMDIGLKGSSSRKRIASAFRY